MGEVIQLQGDQRKDVQEFLVDKKEGLELDAKTIKVSYWFCISSRAYSHLCKRSMVSRFITLSLPGLYRDLKELSELLLHFSCSGDERRGHGR